MSAMLAKEEQWSQLSYPGLLGTFGLLPICLEILKCIEQRGSNFSYQFADVLLPVTFTLYPHTIVNRAVKYKKQHIRNQAAQIFFWQSKAKKSYSTQLFEAQDNFQGIGSSE